MTAPASASCANSPLFPMLRKSAALAIASSCAAHAPTLVWRVLTERAREDGTIPAARRVWKKRIASDWRSRTRTRKKSKARVMSRTVEARMLLLRYWRRCLLTLPKFDVSPMDPAPVRMESLVLGQGVVSLVEVGIARNGLPRKPDGLRSGYVQPIPIPGLRAANPSSCTSGEKK